MAAIIQVIVTAEYDESDPSGGELGEAIGEVVLSLNARHWDNSTLTLYRILAWLRRKDQDHQGAELGIPEPSETEDLGLEAISAG